MSEIVELRRLRRELAAELAEMAALLCCLEQRRQMARLTAARITDYTLADGRL